MRDRKGWKALGYESFKEYGEKELGYQEAHIYRIVDAAEISLQIGYSADSPIGESLPPESHTRPLKSVPEDVRKQIWDEATAKAEAEGDKRTAKHVEMAVAEWKQRSEEWRQQNNESRKKIRELQEQNDLLQSREPEIQVQMQTPADYEETKALAAKQSADLDKLKKQQAILVKDQVAAKLKEREAELSDIDRKVKENEARLAGLQKQIDAYTLRERELKVHLDTIEDARKSMTLLAANLEGFGGVIDKDHELRLWRALSGMMKNGARAIDFFVGDTKPALAVVGER